MDIRFQPRRGVALVELRDIRKCPELGVWNRGDVRTVKAGDLVEFQAGQDTVQLDAATAIFRHGPDFVDVATGKNPLFTCAACGEEALDETMALALPRKIETPQFVDDQGRRLCVGDWLANHPEYMVAVRSKGPEYEAIVNKAQTIIANRSAAKSVPVRQAAPTEE